MRTFSKVLIRSTLFLVALSAPLSAANFEPTWARVFNRRVFPDRIENEGVYRKGVQTANEVFVPITVSLQNPDTTIRGFTGYVVVVPWRGDEIAVTPRLTDIEALNVGPKGTLLVQGRTAFLAWDLKSQQELWRLPVTGSGGALPNLVSTQDGSLFYPNYDKKVVYRLDPETGALSTAFSPESNLAGWGLTGGFDPNHLIVSTLGQIHLTNGRGVALWSHGKVFPQRSYGSGVIEKDGSITHQEYISASNPDVNLRRKTWISSLTAAGQERWSRLADQHYFGGGVSSIYVQEKKGNEYFLESIDLATGKTLWSYRLHNQALVSLIESGQLVHATTETALLTLSGDQGTLVARKEWPQRANTTLQGADGATVVLSQRDANPPHRYYVQRLSLNLD